MDATVPAEAPSVPPCPRCGKELPAGAKNPEHRKWIGWLKQVPDAVRYLVTTATAVIARRRLGLPTPKRRTRSNSRPAASAGLCSAWIGMGVHEMTSSTRGGLAILTFLTIFASVSVEGAILHVAPGATGSGTRRGDPGDLENVVENVSASGDTVNLAAGTYTVSANQIEVAHPLFIRGAGMGLTILDCTAAPHCMDIDSALITKSNTVVGEIENGSPTIRNVEFTGTISVSSVTSRLGHPVILGSTFTATATGLSAQDRSEPEPVSGCAFDGGGAIHVQRESALSYGLRAGSPLVDAAIGANTMALDIRGWARVMPDIGAYER